MKIILITLICMFKQISYGQINSFAHLATNNKNQTASFNLKRSIITINTINYPFTIDTKSCTLTQIVGSIWFTDKKGLSYWLRLVIITDPKELKVYDINTGKLTEIFEF